uniref:Putative nucleolin-like n=1 Tax=Davidia involucrata TaxID=16924 RepID=A0A5B6ZRL5_DAVIN
MPPKKKASSSAALLRRTPRATARKSIPSVPPKSTAQTSPETTPSSAAIPESSASLTSPTKIDTISKSSPKSTAEELPTAKPSQTTPLTSPEINKSPAKSTTKEDFTGARATAAQESKSLSSPKFSAEDSIPETASKSESETAPPEASSEKITETEPKTSEEIQETADQIAPDETLAEKVSPPPEAEGSLVTKIETQGVARKTVVKKTVRVVKKVVKKKVPKRVQKSQAVSLHEDSEEKTVTENEGENPNPSVLGAMEVENPNPIESISMDVENLDSGPNASVSNGVENPQSDVTVSVEAQNPNSNPSVSVSMELENPDTNVTVSMDEACEGEKDASLTEILSEAPVLDSVATENNGEESEKTVSATKTQLEDQNVSSIQYQNDECETENVGSRGGEGEEGVKEEDENCEDDGLKGEVGLGDGVILSGEMEALERRRRRKTEIFIGGLDKDAKEEDIRKIFEEVGEIVEVRLMMNGRTGKNKGFAFVRFALAADAKAALAKYPKVEICGKQCGVAPVEGNDTIFLGNIDKKWKSEDVLKLLQEIGIEKIDKVTVMADPSNIECNRGFAFLELETNKDAQNAYKKLQKKDVFGKHHKIKVAWAEPLNEPDEEEMLKVKSVYAEYIPSSWDEEKVRDYFKKFGEIENVALARNLRSSRRKDFAFVNYTTREAALACIEAFSREPLNDDYSKVNVKVSLAKPIPKGKQIKHISNPIKKESSKVNHKASQPVIKLHEPGNKGKSSSSNYEDIRGGRRSSTTAELVQLLREQEASRRQSQTGLGRGSLNPDYLYPTPGRKRPFSVLGDDPLYSDPRGYPRARLEGSFPMASPSYGGLSQGIGMPSLPTYHQQGPGYASRSFYGAEEYPNSLQTRGPPYHGSSGLYRRY